ncbi:fused signal recognition particle receptor [Mariprofundus micogutta]|uniref:Signal recognition particle receptor FtsY n=1 Tax=Mariprofundus micogutta TaxID=1921010 RepID=A0A1L8CQZ6_9PROT|nr:signal recognition particle-docking protein FtsY [Mariprofundus micogutta]GAV21317.1 fused signal recognition particle receptor [Mariprofundus micogutta]
MSSFFSRLKQGLSRSRDTLAQMVPGGAVDALSEEGWIDIEDGLIMADCGAELSGQLVQKARKRRGASVVALKESMVSMIPEATAVKFADSGPFVLLVVGVNGTGKTTTIGKLATMFRQQGKSVLVGAGDTFRAAAVEQLAVWVERAGADMVRQHEGADPASVAFDTVQRGVARNYDVVIVDTAGRVQTDRGLMDELAKVRRVITKAYPDAPHEVWQVVDGGTGQNAVVQVEKFREVAGTSGLIVTKLDGSGKGGIVLQLSHKFGLPIRYVGVGETLEDLMEFNAEEFISGLLPDYSE